MTARLSVLILCLLSLHLRGQTASLYTVQDNGPRSQRLNLVFLSEGYTTSDLPNFAAHVTNAVNFLFSKEPWQQYRSYCNVYRIEIASNESGCDNGNTSGAGGTRDTYFNAGFNTPSISQLLTLGSGGSSKAYSLLNAHVPEYDLSVVIVNDTKYGGAGGGVSVASVNGSSAAVVEHEIGHSFGLLADEYDTYYAAYTPGERPNNTAETTRSLIRWNHWIEASTPLPTPENTTYNSLAGIFEGSMYRTSGWYRPHYNSVMKSLNRPCGQINREQFVLRFYSRVSPVDGFAPAATSSSVSGPMPLSFSITPKNPSIGPALDVTWKVDGVVQNGQTAPSFSTLSDFVGNGPHTISAEVRDPTPFVRNDPSELLKEVVAWSLTLSGQLPATLSEWRSTYGPDTAVGSPDRMPNLIKYALGLNAGVSAEPEELPVGELTDGGGPSYLRLSVPRRMRRADVTYTVEVSDDLASWHSGTGYTVVEQDDDTMLVVRDAQPASADSQRFIRLSVQPNP